MPPPDFAAMYQRIFAKWTDDAMSGLSAVERNFIVANVCLNQSLNGGLMIYYENSYGERAAEAVEVLRRIGVPRAAEVVGRANLLMGPSGPSRDRDKRGDQLAALSDAAIEEMVDLSDALNAMADEIQTAALRWVQRSGGV